MKYVGMFKSIRKGIALILVLGIGISLLAVSTSAASTAYVSILSSGETINQGEQFAIDIFVEPNYEIAGMQLNFSFDPSIATVDSVVEGDLFSQSGADTYFKPGVIDNTAGTVESIYGVIVSPGQKVSTGEVFATIILTAGTKGGVCPLNLSNVMIGNIEGNSVPLQVVNGTVNVNCPPELNTIGDKTVNSGDLITFNISASDTDGDSLYYSASNLPAGSSFDALTQTFSWIPDDYQLGDYAGVYFEVSDGSQVDFEEITISVIDTNLPPVIDPIGDKIVLEGELLTFTIYATDPDGDSLTYSAANLPEGAYLDPVSGVFSWIPGYDQAGAYSNILFEVSDGKTIDQEVICIKVKNQKSDIVEPDIPKTNNGKRPKNK